VPLILLFLGGFIFGWAKPVPVNFKNLKRPKRDMVIVAAAGPFSNLIMVFLWALVAKSAQFIGPAYPSIGYGLLSIGTAGILINLLLMVLNLLPLPPLDGGRVLVGLLPNRLGRAVSLIEPFGFFILVALLFTGILIHIIAPPIFALQALISNIFGL